MTAPEFWLYFLGALFIAVTLFLPQGVAGLLRSPGGWRGRMAKALRKEEGGAAR